MRRTRNQILASTEARRRASGAATANRARRAPQRVPQRAAPLDRAGRAKGTPVTAAQIAAARAGLTPQQAQGTRRITPNQQNASVQAQAQQQLVRPGRAQPQQMVGQIGIPTPRQAPAQEAKQQSNLSAAQQLALLDAKMRGNSNLKPGGQAMPGPSPMQAPKAIKGATPVQATPQPMAPVQADQSFNPAKIKRQI